MTTEPTTKPTNESEPEVETEGFVWITNRTTQPYVTIDSQQRLYISSPAKDLMGIPKGRYKFSLIAGYDFANHRIVLAKPEIVRVPNIEPYSFDKRSYSGVKGFVSRARLEEMLPIRFIYVGKDYSTYPSGSYAFQMEGREAEDK